MRRNNTDDNDLATNGETAASQRTLPHVLTIKEAASALRVSRWTIYQLIRRRELASFKIGSRRCVPATAVHDLVTNKLAAEAA
jgi:excisionase family DNA binding protein